MTNPLALPSVSLVLLLLGACVSQATPAAQVPASTSSASSNRASCGEAPSVPLSDAARTGGVFTRLFGKHYAELVFTCPGDQSCTLPRDRQVELTIEPLREDACEFASCKVPYLRTLPFTQAAGDECPNVLWSLVKLHLKSDAGTLDEHEAEVNVLASPRGDGFVRFMLESPASFAATPTSPEPRSVLLDVQLELMPTGLRGQLSALAAPLPHEPVSELRFAALWTATWETINPPPAP